MMALCAAAAPQVAAANDLAVPIRFELSAKDAAHDPTGLWTDEEVAESHVPALAPIAYATFPVDGGVVTFAVLQGAWCGMTDCPYRFRLETDAGKVFRSHGGGDYGMSCQSLESYLVDPIDLVVGACGQPIDLKSAR